MKIAVFQFNPSIGDFKANAHAIFQAATQAKEQGAAILITPAFSLSGFPLNSLLAQQSFDTQIDQALEIIKKIENIAVLVNYPQKKGSQLFQAASLYLNGQTLLNEPHPQSSEPSQHDIPVFELKNQKFALMNYADIQTNTPPIADATIIIDSTPYYLERQQEQQTQLSTWIKQHAQPILLIRANGAEEEHIFAGASFALNKQSELSFQSPFCEQGTSIELIEYQQQTFSGSLKPYPEKEEALYQALVCGLQNYVQKSGFQRLCLGLSGGIDSALVLALAVDSVGAENCEVLLMPSQYTAELSNSAAEKMAKNLKVRYHTVPIIDIFNSFKTALSERFTGLTEDLTEENLQARIRGTLLMALSNKTNAMLLSTGNKSEIAMGYSTLYGDTNGGFSPLKDLLKTEVYAISRWLNQHHKQEIIPQEIIDRPPSAELRPNQTDQDSLPEYAQLDAMIIAILEKGYGIKQLIQAGFDATEAKRTLKRLQINEYKRRQGALGPKISRQQLGTDWQLPLCQHFDFQ